LPAAAPDESTARSRRDPAGRGGRGRDDAIRHRLRGGEPLGQDRRRVRAQRGRRFPDGSGRQAASRRRGAHAESPARTEGDGVWQAPVKLNDTTRAFFERLAKISPPEKAWYYTHLDDPKTDAYLRANDIGLNSMLRTSIVPTIIKGGFRENVIPAEAEATLDV